MKALEILKSYIKFDGYIRDIVNIRQCNEAMFELQQLQKHNEILKNALIKLTDERDEALQNRRCETCRFWEHDTEGDIDTNLMFGVCEMYGIEGKFHYCSNHELRQGDKLNEL